MNNENTKINGGFGALDLNQGGSASKAKQRTRTKKPSRRFSAPAEAANTELDIKKGLSEASATTTLTAKNSLSTIKEEESITLTNAGGSAVEGCKTVTHTRTRIKPSSRRHSTTEIESIKRKGIVRQNSWAAPAFLSEKRQLNELAKELARDIADEVAQYYFDKNKGKFDTDLPEEELKKTAAKCVNKTILKSVNINLFVFNQSKDFQNFNYFQEKLDKLEKRFNDDNREGLIKDCKKKYFQRKITASLAKHGHITDRDESISSLESSNKSFSAIVDATGKVKEYGSKGATEESNNESLESDQNDTNRHSNFAKKVQQKNLHKGLSISSSSSRSVLLSTGSNSGHSDTEYNFLPQSPRMGRKRCCGINDIIRNALFGDGTRNSQVRTR